MTVLPLSPDELLTTTRSVRKRLDLTRPVPLELVRECLEAALQAPTGGNRQGWHWVVVTDPELRAGIAGYYRRSFAAYRDSAARGSAVGDAARVATQRRVLSSSDHLAEHMAEVPVLVLACIEAAAELPADNQAGLWGSLLPAAWSYQLAARARGLGTAWTTLHLRYEREVSELLGIPSHVRHGVLLPTAYYTGEAFRPAPRASLDHVLHLDSW
ncbi:MAG TPA: nitroreductase family protein [Streptosporangiaceae bacterium]|nr:nitroreductase family protein [Streptosporangiaceae bacterium]